MDAYNPETWHEFFVMIGGASAALAGLIFVAVSLNHEEILKYAALPSLAARTLWVLIGVVLLSAFGLVPGQSALVLGIEILALGVVLMTGVLITAIRHARHSERLWWKVSLLSIAIASTLPMVVAGASLAAGVGGGLYWALAEVVLGLVASMYNAWILLIEIRR